MGFVIRYVDKKGCIVERFIAMIHVPNTTALSLKTTIEELFARHGLSITKLRGQGYDGASNMQGEYNGLKSLILKENKNAYYIHCFAHQLQLALLHVSEDIPKIAAFFTLVTRATKAAGGSCKRRDILRAKKVERIQRLLDTSELSTGQGINQEIGIKRPCDTRWSSHYGTIINLITMFSSVIEVLEEVLEDTNGSKEKGDALLLLDSMRSFEFAFNLHLMKDILNVSNDLSKALQRKDQDIVNAMTLVKLSKQRLQKFRESGWASFFEDVNLFFHKHGISVIQMDDDYVPPGISRRYGQVTKFLHHYQVDLFYACIDKQQFELNNRFDEVNMELLVCMSCLNPKDLFVAFDINKLVRLAEFYPDDFSEQERVNLENQLEVYKMDMKYNDAFKELNGISSLAKRMVETGKDVVYNLVYKLIKLSLILPVATATVERAFSAMNIVKTRLRNRMGDKWLNDCLITYIEKAIFSTISDEVIMKRFQKMKKRKGQL